MPIEGTDISCADTKNRNSSKTLKLPPFQKSMKPILVSKFCYFFSSASGHTESKISRFKKFVLIDAACGAHNLETWSFFLQYRCKATAQTVLPHWWGMIVRRLRCFYSPRMQISTSLDLFIERRVWLNPDFPIFEHESVFKTVIFCRWTPEIPTITQLMCPLLY